MDGDDMHRTQEGVSQDFRPRREERVKLLTTEKESLCLYGLLNETWEVNLAAKQVTPEILESVPGLNFARDGIYEEDWPSHVVVHSDAWLPAVALYFGARFGFVIESRTNLMKLSDYKDGFLMKHSENFGAVSWFVKTAVSVLQNQTIMNAVTDSGNVVYKDYIDASAAVGTSKGLVLFAVRDSDTMNFAEIKKYINHFAKKAFEACLYQCHKKNSQDSNKQVDLAGRVAAKINILVRLLSGRTACICVCKTDYIGQLVSHIEDQEGIPKMHMMLLYGRTTLEDGCCLSDYNMENNSTVNVIYGLRGGCRLTLHDFLSHEQNMLEQSDNWTYDQKWLTDDAKRKIHSTYRVIFLLHGNNLCLGDILLKDIPIYLDRAIIPPTASEPFTVEKGRRDYASFIAYLKERFSTLRPIELVNFLNALEDMPDDILDEEYHRYLFCYWGLMTSARRSDYMIETGNICKEGKQEAQEELKEIMIPINPDNWLYSILREEPFLDLNNKGKIPSYASANRLAILIFMRDSLEHARGTCNRLQMEKIFYTKYWVIWDTLNRSLIEKKSDLINL